MRTKLEEIRQAMKIHGGVVGFCVAALGVKLSRMPIPTRLRRWLFHRLYGKKYAALDENEFEHPLLSYPSINALFTRGVKPEYRPIAEALDAFLCPCDCKVQDAGRLAEDRLMTVKGIEYTLASLLPGLDTRPFHGGPFGIFFLSPADCHRIFSPHEVRVEEVIHIPGYRLLVHPPFQRAEYPVFTLNERVIFRLATPLGACILVMVAGWGVGNITLTFDHSFRPRRRQRTHRVYPAPVALHRGQWMATFELGSTVILMAEAAQGLELAVGRDQKLKYGEIVFRRTGTGTEGGHS